MNSTILILGLSILLVNLRLLIFGILEMPLYARTTLIIPILLGAWMLRGKISQTIKEWKLVSWETFFTVSLTVTGIFHGIALAAGKEKIFTDIIPYFSSSSFFIIFPLMMLSLKLSSETWLKVVFIVGIPIVWVSSLMMMFLHLADKDHLNHIADRFREHILPSNLTETFGHTYVFPSVRNLGHLSDLAASSVAIGALSLMFLTYSILALPKRSKFGMFLLFTSYLGFAGVYFSTSIWSIAIFGGLLGLVFLVGLSSEEFRRSGLSYYAACPMFLMAYLSLRFFNYTYSPGQRLLAYAKDWTILDRFTIETAGEVQASTVLWQTSKQGIGLDTNEFHFLLGVKRIGLIPNIGWVIFVFSFLFFFRPKLLQDKKALCVFLGCSGFLLGSFHYDALSFWGNNYLYALMWLVLISGYRSQGETPVEAQVKTSWI